MERVTIYIKEGKYYIESHSITDPETIYKQLTTCLIAKKINCCTWIKSIKRENLYNGYQKITIVQDNGIKEEYIIKE